MNENLIAIGKDPKHPTNSFISKYEPLFVKWKATKFPEASTSASDSASVADKAPASKSASASLHFAKNSSFSYSSTTRIPIKRVRNPCLLAVSKNHSVREL
jgi:hypothetical protein